MASRLNPYLNFDGNSRQAMEFYQSALGGHLEINTFSDYGAAPEGVDPAGVMHARLETDAGFVLMASDPGPQMTVTTGNDFSISLSGTDEAELRGYWEKLSEGAEIRMPLEKQMWGDTFGMLVDKFGKAWMVDIGSAEAAQPSGE